MSKKKSKQIKDIGNKRKKDMEFENLRFENGRLVAAFHTPEADYTGESPAIIARRLMEKGEFDKCQSLVFAITKEAELSKEATELIENIRNS